MKKRYKFIYLILTLISMLALFSSCAKSNSNTSNLICSHIYDNYLYYEKPINSGNYGAKWNLYRYDLENNKEQCIFPASEIMYDEYTTDFYIDDSKIYFYKDYMYCLYEKWYGEYSNGYYLLKMDLNTVAYEILPLGDSVLDFFENKISLDTRDIYFENNQLYRGDDLYHFIDLDLYGVFENKLVLYGNFEIGDLDFNTVFFYNIDTKETENFIMPLIKQNEYIKINGDAESFDIKPISVNDDGILLCLGDYYFYEFSSGNFEKIEYNFADCRPLFENNGYIYYLAYGNGTFTYNDGNNCMNNIPTVTYVKKILIEDTNKDYIIKEFNGYVINENCFDVMSLCNYDINSNQSFYLINRDGEIKQPLIPNEIIDNDSFTIIMQSDTIIYSTSKEDHPGLPSSNEWIHNTKYYSSSSKSNELKLLFEYSYKYIDY